MLKVIQKTVVNIVNRFGFDIIRIHKPDLSLYNSYPRKSLEQLRFYNIGAGAFKHPYWTNIDYATEHYKGIQKHRFINYNLMELKPLPIESNVAEIVYSSHVIEHINDEAVLNMLKEAYRILKVGGCIRVTTPDMLLEYQAYKRNDIKFWYWRDEYSRPGSWEELYKIPLSKASIHQLFVHHFASQLCEIDIDDSPPRKYSDPEIIEVFSKYSMEDALDYFTKQCKYNIDHPGNHISWWTHDKLIALLKKAGFSKCYKTGYGQSQFPPLREINYFDKTYPIISLYVEAIK